LEGLVAAGTTMMQRLSLSSGSAPLRILCLGAHSDDIEIGCGGTLLQWLRDHPSLEIVWAVASAANDRKVEARKSARALLRRAKHSEIFLGEFEDGYFPASFGPLKAFFQSVRNSIAPDVIFTHRLEDRHQDHRIVAELTWQIWRDHLILEYEIPKYEGDLGQPNAYVPLDSKIAQLKVEHLMRYFDSQRSKPWFVAESFSSLLRVRGIESKAASGLAEAFYARKFIL
jgi:LmbE family N-acetylglucosaminyl deacetylase